MAGVTIDQDNLEAEIARLRDLDLPGLRVRWRSVFRGTAPDHLPRHLLFRILAYRLQAERLGDLDRDTRRFLDRVATGAQAGNEINTADRNPSRNRLQPGTILVREWNGALQRVMALEEGFAWNGTTYRSLTEVAYAITGTRWSGPRFFGLHDRPKEVGMTAKAPNRIRCAVYTRVSTEYGLDQEFNSLDAQHEAAEAYIRSQAHDGWTLLRTRYDDGGYSGGSTDRPALQSLIGDIRAKKIDIIVVYKVDRLTRSLADFAKLVELFDAHGVSFVSVTQQFNTTTSMGRLTLNVLLSFAQFEREVTSERIRDKIAASKRKGIWVGGNVPLGYENRDKKLVIHEQEAERVRLIFQRYLALGSIGHLLSDLRSRGIVTKARSLSDGQPFGGIPFTRGPLAYLLRNRCYIGEVVHKGTAYPGEHAALLDRDLFEAVQRRLGEQRTHHVTERSKSEALLLGRIFDDRGNRMTPSHCRKAGTKYRYYTSAALTQGQPEHVGAIARVPAAEIEAVVGAALRRHLGDDDTQADTRQLIRTHVVRVEVRPAELAITLARSADAITPDKPGAELDAPNPPQDSSDPDGDRPTVLIVPYTKPPAKRRREIIVPEHEPSGRVRPIRSESRARLVAAIARGRLWLAQITSGAVGSVTELALGEDCSARHVNMTISLAFLAPPLVKAAVEGRLPRGIGLSRLVDAPAEWAHQYKMLGLTPG